MKNIEQGKIDILNKYNGCTTVFQNQTSDFFSHPGIPGVT